MRRSLRDRLPGLLPVLALGLATFLGGCVVAPAYPGYGYGYGAPYYPAPVVTFGGGGWGHNHYRGGW
jgi:hypothetical protein